MTMPTHSIPFVGLRTFEATDQHWFRGRDQEIVTLLNKVRNNHFTAVVGASGSGKSSLVRAGILPSLEKEGVKSIILKPGSAPISKLALALSEAAREDTVDSLAEARSYHYDTTLRQSAFGLSEITSRLAPDAPQLLLVVDQFEELFRYGEEAQGLKKDAMEEESHAFVELLLTAASHSASRVHVVITMRSDFFGKCAIYPGLAEAVSASQYLVPLPSRDQLETIIRGPIADAGGRIENMLVQRLLLDVAKEIDLLPTLQHTLRRLWEVASGESKQLRAEDYQTIGGIKGSINVKAEQIVVSLKQSHEDDYITLERIMKAITLLDEQGRATRRPQHRSALFELITEVLGHRERAEASLNRVLQILASEDASFIQLGAGSDPEIDISHEALIRNWQRLCGEKRDFKIGWLLEEREDGRQWWNLVRRAEKQQLLSLRDARNISNWIKQKKFGSQWCHRYGDTWQFTQQFLHSSFIKKSIAWSLAGMIIVSIVGSSILSTWYSYHETLRQTRYGALATAGYARSIIENGNTRLGALIALYGAPDNNDISDPRYVDEIRIALADALTRPIEIMRRSHGGTVFSVAFSPDGNQLISASSNGSLQLWDARTGLAIGDALRGHIGAIRDVAFSPDGSLIASGGKDGSLRLWDTKNKKEIGPPLLGHEKEIRSIAFSPDGSQLASVSLDETIRIWDMRTRMAAGAPLRGHVGAVRSVTFSPDGNQLASGGEDSTLRLWDARNGEAIGKPLRGHKGAIRDISFSPDGSLIASGGEDGTLRLWNVKDKKGIVKILDGHEGEVRSVSFASDGNQLVTGSEDNTIRLWNVRTGEPIGIPIRGHEGTVQSVSFSPNVNQIVSGGNDRTIRFWNIPTGAAIRAPLSDHRKSIRSVSFSPDSTQMVSSDEDGVLLLWNIKTGEVIGRLLHGHGRIVFSVTFSPDGSLIASGDEDGMLRLWDVKDKSAVGTHLLGHKGKVRSVAFSPDGKQLVTGSEDNTIRLWNAQTSEAIGEPLHGHKGAVFSVAFSTDGTRLISASADGTLLMWNPHTGKSIGAPLSGHVGAVRSVAFSSDSSLIISGGDDGTLRLWDAKSKKQIGEPLRYHKGGIWSVAFSPHGNLIVSGGEDKTLRLWNMITRTTIGSPLRGHEGGIRSVAFSPNGNLLVSGSEDNTLRLWDPNIFFTSFKELTDNTEKLCPLSEAELRQLGLYDPQNPTSAKTLTPDQRLACGE